MDFEERLPKPHKDYYVPALDSLPVTTDSLNQEAKRMMEFLGIGKYQPKCAFVELSGNTAGNTNAFNENIEVEINVSVGYRNNLAACLAVLAHEVCHKYLYVNGICCDIPIVNEIYADLCTMYVGFGHVIKTGYITETQRGAQRQIHFLGYLEFPIYERTLRIIRVVLWNEEENTNNEKDPLLEDAFKIWLTKRDKKELSKDSLISVGSGIAEMERNFFILRNIFTLLTARYNRDFDEAEEKLYQEDWFDGELIAPKKRFAVFRGIYQSVLLSEDGDENQVLNEVNRYMRALIAHIVGISKINQLNLVASKDFTCPHCGTHHVSDKFSGRKALIVCPKCKRRFIADCQDFNFTTAQYELGQYKAELIKPIRQRYIKSLESETQSHYNKGYANGAYAKNEELKQKLSGLPFWLRWLIGNRLDL